MGERKGVVHDRAPNLTGGSENVTLSCKRYDLSAMISSALLSQKNEIPLLL